MAGKVGGKGWLERLVGKVGGRGRWQRLAVAADGATEFGGGVKVAEGGHGRCVGRVGGSHVSSHLAAGLELPHRRPASPRTNLRSGVGGSGWRGTCLRDGGGPRQGERRRVGMGKIGRESRHGRIRVRELGASAQSQGVTHSDSEAAASLDLGLVMSHRFRTGRRGRCTSDHPPTWLRRNRS